MPILLQNKVGVPFFLEMLQTFHAALYIQVEMKDGRMSFLPLTENSFEPSGIRPNYPYYLTLHR